MQNDSRYGMVTEYSQVDHCEGETNIETDDKDENIIKEVLDISPRICVYFFQQPSGEIDGNDVSNQVGYKPETQLY